MPTSLRDVITFTIVWMARTGFRLIFLSKKVNETQLAMHSISKNWAFVCSVPCFDKMEIHQLVKELFKKKNYVWASGNNSSLGTQWDFVNLLLIFGTRKWQNCILKSLDTIFFSCITVKLFMKHVFFIMHHPKTSIARSTINFKYSRRCVGQGTKVKELK